MIIKALFLLLVTFSTVRAVAYSAVSIAALPRYGCRSPTLLLLLLTYSAVVAAHLLCCGCW
jgi:hypothetical protein